MERAQEGATADHVTEGNKHVDDETIMHPDTTMETPDIFATHDLNESRDRVKGGLQDVDDGSHRKTQPRPCNTPIGSCDKMEESCDRMLEGSHDGGGGEESHKEMIERSHDDVQAGSCDITSSLSCNEYLHCNSSFATHKSEANESTPLTGNENVIKTEGDTCSDSPFTTNLLLKRFAAIFVCSAVCITAICTNIFVPSPYRGANDLNNSTIWNATLVP